MPKALQKITGKADLQMLDMGVAMAHMELSLNAQGVFGSWMIELPNTDVTNKWEYIATYKTETNLFHSNIYFIQ